MLGTVAGEASKMRISSTRLITTLAALMLAMSNAPAPSAMATEGYVIELVAEARLAHIPPGPLYWRVETFPTLAQASAARGPASLAAELAGTAWLFTLGPQGGSTFGARRAAEIGPLPTVSAPVYLLRVNHASGPPGARTPVHAHPGSETFFVLGGRLDQRTPHGTVSVEAGQSMAGHAPGLPMEVSSNGASDLDALVMFVVDASRPFSLPAHLE